MKRSIRCNKKCAGPIESLRWLFQEDRNIEDIRIEETDQQHAPAAWSLSTPRRQERGGIRRGRGARSA
jgi:hypothetical protein